MNVKEMLNLSIMDETKLIAGQKGILNKINWVTIVEILEDSTRLQKGEFLITTGFELNKPIRKKAFLRLIESRKISALAIYTSFYIKEIPKEIIDKAEEVQLPLIEIPTDINFSLITRDILEQLINDQMRLATHSLAIHKKLTTHVLENKSLQDITNTLSELTEGSIYLFDEFFNTIHKCIADKKHMIQHHTLINYFLKIENTNLYSEREFNGNKVFISPILAKEVNYGWILCIKPLRYWKEIDQVAIEHAATVYAIELLKQQALQENDIRNKGDLINELMVNNYQLTPKLTDKLKEYHFDLTKKFVYFYITFLNTSKQTEGKFIKLYQLIESILLSYKFPFLIQIKNDRILILLNLPSNFNFYQETDDLAEKILKQWNFFYHQYPLLIGISSCCSDISRLDSYYKESNYSVRLHKLLKKEFNVYHFEDYSNYTLLIEAIELGINLDKYICEPFKKLKHTKKYEEIRRTISCYFKHNKNISSTSKELFIHRHTLKYRLEQFEKVSGYDLTNLEHCFKIQLSLMALKLKNILEI